MRLQRYRHRCRSCRTEYFLPWADLSFFYGTFLGKSRRGEVAVLDSFSDPIFDEVSMLVGNYLGPQESYERGAVVRQVISAVSDKDSHGDPFVLDGLPGCPKCGKKRTAKPKFTGEEWMADVPPLSHEQWDSWPFQQRAQAVKALLAEMGLQEPA